MTLKGIAEPHFTAEMFFVDSSFGGGFGWQCWASKEIAFQGGYIGTAQEAINNFESDFADKYPDAGKWTWEEVADPYEACSANGEVGDKNSAWTLIEDALNAQAEFVCWDNAVAIDMLEGKFRFELKFQALLRAFAASHGLVPQRWNDGSVTWLKNIVAGPCAYCGATDPIDVGTGDDFPGSRFGRQLVCGCGAAGPHAANSEDAIVAWNRLMAKG